MARARRVGSDPARRSDRPRADLVRDRVRPAGGRPSAGGNRVRRADDADRRRGRDATGPLARYVAVVGASQCSPELFEQARAAGRRLAEGGAFVVSGGRGGVMEAACRGAKEGGGTTIGILPTLDRGDANRYVDVVIPTGLGEGRNLLVVRAADALVAVGGAWGTLTEIAFARQLGRPVFGVGSWELGEDGVVAVADGAEAAERALAVTAAG